MALSVNDLVQRTRDLLGEAPSVLTSTTTGTGTSITVSDPTALSLGDILEWQTGTVGFEQMLITVDPAGANPITVARGVNGTTAESHTAGDSLFVGPNFTGRQTQQALRAGIRKLWPYVYIVTPVTVTPTLSVVWHNVNTAVEIAGMVGARQKWGTGVSIYQGIYVGYGTKGGLPVVWDWSVDTSICASGYGVRFPSGMYSPTTDITVQVASAVTGTADIEDTGRWPVADCLAYFAAGRMTGALEIPRVAAGGDLESAGSVGTGARTTTGFVFMAQAQSLLQTLGIRYRNFHKPLDVQ